MLRVIHALQTCFIYTGTQTFHRKRNMYDIKITSLDVYVTEEFRKVLENSRIFGKLWNFRKIREFPENPGISENPGENFRDFGENFFREFSKLQKVRTTFRKNSLFL